MKNNAAYIVSQISLLPVCAEASQIRFVVTMEIIFADALVFFAIVQFLHYALEWSIDMNLDEELKKASILVEALPYIQKFNRKIIVVKYGGSAMVDEALKRKVIQDVVLLKLVGFKPIIVHGGGKGNSRVPYKV